MKPNPKDLLHSINIPNLIHEPIGQLSEDGKTVHLHPSWFQLFDHLIRELQTNIGFQGFRMPQQPTEEATFLLTGGNQNGKIIYDNKAHAYKGCVNGMVKTFTLV